VEIYVSKLFSEQLSKMLEPIPQKPLLTIVYDGNPISNYSFDEFLKNRKKLYNMNYDFILYEIPINKKDKYDKYDKYVLRYETIADVINVEYNSLKSFDLNMIQITINDNKDNIYNIDFGRTQYIINGNILLDRSFLKWYLNMNFDVLLQDEDRYCVTFIDHNMNYVTLTEKCYLLIKKNYYDIIYIENDIKKF
jgi:hypothetical protein